MILEEQSDLVHTVCCRDILKGQADDTLADRGARIYESVLPCLKLRGDRG